MKVLKYIIFLLLIVVIGLGIYIGVQPNNYEVTRTRSIEAPAAVIYDYVIDFKTWESWSSWLEKKPETKITYSELSIGLGGSYSWEDDDGTGSMETTNAIPYSVIEQMMQFEDYEPAKVGWSFEPTEDGHTKVSWTMTGTKVPFFYKAYAAYKGGFDKMIGPDFERGLEKLDGLIVASVNSYNISIEGIKEYGGGFYLYKTTNATNANISQVMGQQYGSLISYLTQNGIAMNGMPMTVYHDMNMENGSVVMSNGIPVSEKIDVIPESGILCGYIPKTKVLKATLTGNYTYLSEAWQTTMDYIKANNLIQSEEKPFEIYINDPGNFPNPAHWKTEIYIPIKE